jgi:hypothetical protein
MTMKIIKLKYEEILFLKSECSSGIINSYLRKGFFDEKSSSLILMLPTTELVIFEDELLQILADKGVDENGEINTIGKKLTI